jgi:hypothetical protein
MATNSEEQREFAKWVLNVGGGNLHAIVEGVDPDWIKISSRMMLLVEDCSLRGLIQTIYLDHRCHFGGAMYLMQHNILAPQNINIDEVNNAILESLSEKSHMYLSANSLTLTKKRCKCCYRSFNGFIVFGGISKHFAIQRYYKS